MSEHQYNREWAEELEANGELPELMCFWGHSERGGVSKSCFSQWYPSVFEIDGDEFPTAEHAMMCGKARLFDDENMAKEILKSADPKRAKALGRKVQNFDESLWRAEREGIVFRANVAKFSQNESLGSFLLATGDRLLVEASPYDRIWGVGFTQDDPAVQTPSTWDGDNLLGFVLMAVRDQLRGQAD